MGNKITREMIIRGAEVYVGGAKYLYEYPYNDYDRAEIFEKIENILKAALSVED